MATLKDIAAKTNLSITTVSRVLNRDASLQVPVETKQAVLKAAEALGYQRRRSRIKSLKHKRIAVLMWLPEDTLQRMPHFLSIKEGVIDAARLAGVTTKVIYKTLDQPLNKAMFTQCDGIIAVGKFLDKDVQRLKSQTTNIVFVDSSPDTSAFETVVIDFRLAIKQMFKLVNRLPKPVALIAAQETFYGKINYGERRKTMMVEQLKQQNTFEPKMMMTARFSKQDGEALCDDLLKKHQPKTIVCGSDYVAAGVLKALEANGLNVPQDVTVIGFYDDYATKAPSLTTLHVPSKAMGQEAFYSLMTHIEMRHKIPVKKVMPTSMIIRESTPGGHNNDTP